MTKKRSQNGRSRKANTASPRAMSLQKKAKAAGLHNVCVYCGSGSGSKPDYVASARTLGRDLARAGVGLVYGGGGLGLMGEVARSTMAENGQVIGIIPDFLSELEHMLKGVDELIVTENMHERKQLMFDKADGFVALPGGIGTLEELVEQLTWAQLGRHNKPVVIANINQYWTPFLDLIEHMKQNEFIRDGLEVPFRVVDRATDIIPTLIASRVESAKVSEVVPEDTEVVAKM